MTEIQERARQKLAEVLADLGEADALVGGVGSLANALAGIPTVVSLPARLINRHWYADYIRELQEVIRGERFELPERPKAWRPAGR